MQANILKELLEKYLNNTATAEEKALLEAWYASEDRQSQPLSQQQINEDQLEALGQLFSRIPAKKKPLNFQLLAVVFIVISIFTGFALFSNHKALPKIIPVVKSQRHDALPGGYKASITLSNGQKIPLASQNIGTIASQGNITIKKTANGKIIYSGNSSTLTANQLVYNTASTQRGGLYEFVLADGTQVWLNSASSLRYPVQFTGNSRRVELTGEAYFHVAHNPTKKFTVVVNGQVIEDIGTQFDVNAYSDEPVVKTTLVEGSVKIHAGAASAVLKPGEQAAYNGKIISVDRINVNEAIAWKKGLFYFEDSDLKEVMRQLSRWYDLDVKYEGNIPFRQFSGQITRNVNASQILDLLSFEKIHYRIDGKNLIINP